MTARIIDGKTVAEALLLKIGQQVTALKQQHITPTLAVILVGEDPASQVYVRNKVLKAEATGIRSIEKRLPATTDQATLLTAIANLNQDDSVNGILVQLPLPIGIDEQAVIQAIDPAKDVDGFHPVNTGALTLGYPALVPCTPLGCMQLLKEACGSLDALSGKHAVIVGRSNIVGKPMAALLLQQHCTVTIIHSRTPDAPALARQADILVCAIGRPEMIGADWVKPGAVVIDVGINRISADGKTRLVGDVAFAEVRRKAAAITPVPGGVGPMTIACLMQNTLTATRLQHHLPTTDISL